MANIKEILLPAMVAFHLLYPMAFAVNEDHLLVKYDIHITNDLPILDRAPNVPVLYLHCKSRDFDFGEKKLLKCQDYTWYSLIDYFRTTLFFCNAQWEGKQRLFEAFKATRDEHRCQVYHESCFWSVRKDGIYFSGDNSTWYNEYPW